jgi:hypothetical protein
MRASRVLRRPSADKVWRIVFGLPAVPRRKVTRRWDMRRVAK